MQSRQSNTGSVLSTLVIAAFASTALADDAPTKRELSDAELDRVTAGAAGVDEATGDIVFDVTKTTRSGSAIHADGTLKLMDAADFLRAAELTLGDNAQQNLSSLVNINAIDSTINVLLNLNVTIDSTIGELNQLNLVGTLPVPVSVPGNAPGK